jgi:hypothetical protein
MRQRCSSSRALEVLLGADDVGGDLAELYGYEKRSLPITKKAVG